MSTLPPSPKRRPALLDLMADILDPQELERFLREAPEGEDLVQSLPAGRFTEREYVDAAIEQLLNRGTLDASFFDRLEAQCPLHRERIHEVRQIWDLPCTQRHGPLPSPLLAPRNLKRALGALIALAGLSGSFGYFLLRPDPVEQPTDSPPDLVEQLVSQGFKPNPGLSELMLPGSVLQSTRLGSSGQPEPLDPPQTFLSRETCLQGLTGESAPRESVLQPYSLGDTTHAILPRPGIPGMETGLPELVGLRRLALVTGEIDGAFPQECVDRLMANPDWQAHREWFAFVTEAVVARALVYPLRAEGLSEEQVRARLVDSLPSGSVIQVESLEDGNFRARVEGDFVVASRSRTLEPVSAPDPSKTLIAAPQDPAQESPSQDNKTSEKISTRETRSSSGTSPGLCVSFYRENESGKPIALGRHEPLKAGAPYRLEVTPARAGRVSIHFKNTDSSETELSAREARAQELVSQRMLYALPEPGEKFIVRLATRGPDGRFGASVRTDNLRARGKNERSNGTCYAVTSYQPGDVLVAEVPVPGS